MLLLDQPRDGPNGSILTIVGAVVVTCRFLR